MKEISIPGTDLSVSAICYGTADLGVDMDEDRIAALLDLYRESGGRFIDTAHVYACWSTAGAGSSESAVGRYMKRHPDHGFVVATKGGHPGLAGYRRTDHWLDPYRVRADIDDSLGRLGVDTIDLYYLHRDDTRVGVDEIIDMLNAEVAAGRIRYLGASNWSRERLAEANAYAARSGRAGFVISEIEYSLASRRPPEPLPHGQHTVFAQSGDIEYHTRSGLPMCAFASTGRGFFAADSQPKAGRDSEVNLSRRERARQLAGERHCTATQVALAWLMHHPFPCIPITGSVSLQHLRENLGAGELTLTAEEVAWLRDG